MALRQEGTDLREALAEAEDIIRGERRLVASLQADHAKIKVRKCWFFACESCFTDRN